MCYVAWEPKYDDEKRFYYASKVEEGKLHLTGGQLSIDMAGQTSIKKHVDGSRIGRQPAFIVRGGNECGSPDAIQLASALIHDLPHTLHSPMQPFRLSSYTWHMDSSTVTHFGLVR